jgi:hypothetical protein
LVKEITAYDWKPRRLFLFVCKNATDKDNNKRGKRKDLFKRYVHPHHLPSPGRQRNMTSRDWEATAAVMALSEPVRAIRIIAQGGHTVKKKQKIAYKQRQFGAKGVL